jgi:hypothetical protein
MVRVKHSTRVLGEMAHEEIRHTLVGAWTEQSSLHSVNDLFAMRTINLYFGQYGEKRSLMAHTSKSQSVYVGACLSLKALCANLFSLLFLFVSAASAQVVITANVPAYPFQVLPGSTRQINVNITTAGVQCTAPTSQCTANWNVLSTTGGASATFTTPAGSGVSSVSAGLPTVQVNIGTTAGNCSISGSMGSYVVSSTATITVQAQSVDNPASAATFLFNVCAKTTTVMVAPAYQQAYQGQHSTLQSWVSGDTDETGTWSIVSQPSNGNGVLADTSFRDADFVATVTGRYTLQYTSNSNSSESATAIVYVSPNALPSYATTSTPNETRPHECYLDPALSGGDYEVGVSKEYTTVSSVPVITSWTPGTIMRIWNTDTTGSNPSTFYEYFQIKNSGTATQPIIVCGVPDSYGNLPILDGNNAVGQSGISTGGAAKYGIMSTWAGPGVPTNYWQNGSAGPSYVSITGLHLRHANSSYSLTPPGGGAEESWAGASCVNVRSGTYVDVSGNDMDTCSNGFFSDNNASGQYRWAPVTQLVTVTGNHIHGSGEPANYSYHQAYFQSFYGLMQGNRLDNYLSTASGSNIKWRGVEGIFRYNYLSNGPVRSFDLVENQDGAQYTTFEGAGVNGASYLGAPGDTNCANSYYCSGDTAGANIIAAYQESAQKDFIYGNEIFAGPTAAQQIHYAADVLGGMTNRNGTLYFYSNTLDKAVEVFDNGENGDGMNPVFQPRVDARNNIIWAQTQSGLGLDHYQTLILSSTTNLYETGSVSITTPITGAPGWYSGCDSVCLWPLSSPLNTHMYGLSSANFLLTPTQPYNATTFVPVSGSAAIGAGTALIGIPAELPVRWQFNTTTNSLLPRGDPLTIGAADETGIPAAATPTFSPAAGTYTSYQTVTISDAATGATIFYTTDGTTPTYPISGTTQQYSNPITVIASETLSAIAVASGAGPSAVGSAAYILNLPSTATPTFSLTAGSYATTQTLTISDTTNGASIYYTTDGSTPTYPISGTTQTYSGPLVLTVSQTVKAIGVLVNYAPSAVQFAAYTIGVAQPTFSLSSGTYNGVQTLTISDTTPGATIYYTTNGTTPTTSSTVYTSPIPISTSETVEAIGAARGYNNSVVQSAAYTIELPVITPNLSAYPFVVLPGSTRQINANITIASSQCTAPTSRCTANWSVLSTTGGASATFTTPAGSGVSSVSGGLATVQVNIGSTAGNCSISGSMGSYVVSSTATVTVQAQSVDNPASTAIFLFNVCAKTTTVMVAPAYQQAYQGQHSTLQSWVSGDTDETGTWSIVSQPPRGNGVLADTSFRDADFVATVTGRYTLKYTSHSNSSQSATAIVYVSPNALPSYATTSTPNETRPHECYLDPAFTGGDYEVGVSKEYTTVSSVPVITSWAPGTIMRIWNTDTTGSNPSTFHEYFQIKNSGTATQPIIVCGVPDSYGNLPILDGQNAVGQSDISNGGGAAGAGIMSLWPGPGTPYNYWQSGSAGPSYVSITGLHLRHAGNTYGYTPPAGGAQVAWSAAAACVNVRSGAYVDVSGNDMDTCGNGFFSDDNTATYWWSLVTQLVTVTGNHIHGSGEAGSSSYHQAYFQSFYGLFQGNRLDNDLSTASNSNIKWRGVEGIFRYNYLSNGPVRSFDLVENQDAPQYTTFEGVGINNKSYLGAPGDTTCADSYYCSGDTAGANIIAAYQESAQKDFIYGNEIFAGPTASQQIHYAADVLGGMTNRNGTLYFYSNTLDKAVEVFDNGENGDGMNPVFQPRVDARNNIIWAQNVGGLGLDHYQTLILNSTTNLYETGSISITTPITGAPGWYSGCDSVCLWPLSSPLNTHMYGLSSANFLLTSTQAYNATTFVPVSGSAAIGAGTALTGIPAELPVRWQFNTTTNSLLPRGDPLTIGAADETGIPSASTPTFSPAAGAYTSYQTVTISDAATGATIFYTTDGSTPTYPISGTTQQYSSPITVIASETLNAIAVSSGYANSAVGSATYTINLPVAATPTFTPGTGSYTSAQTVTISTTTSPATIYYTTDGTTPTINSTVYSTPITVSVTETVKAIATATNYTNSAIGSAIYTITAGGGSAPSYAQQCSYYSTGGNGTGASCTLTGVKAGDALVVGVWSESATLSSVTSSTTAQPVSEISNYGADGNYDNYGYMSAYILPNATAGSITITAMQTSYYSPIFISVVEYTGVAASPFDASGTGYIRVYGAASLPSSTFTTTAANDMLWSMCSAYSGEALTVGTAPITWTSRGSYTTNVDIFWEDGMAGAAGTHYGDCYKGGDGYGTDIISIALKGASKPVAGTPSFSLGTGTYNSVQKVTISDSTPSSTIYYTTNGTTPTTSSPVYSIPITVSATETVKAIATATGYAQSATASAAYTITLTRSSYLQQCSNYAAGGNGVGASCTLTGVTAGDALVIGVWSNSPTLSSVTSSTTAQPVSEISNYFVDGNDSMGYMSAYILSNVPSGGITITANQTGYYDSVVLTVVEYTGVAASPFDASGTGYIHVYGAASLPSSTYTTTAANDMLWSMCSSYPGEALTVGTAPITWTSLGTYTTNVDIFWEDGLAGAAGTYYGDCYKGGDGYGTDIISIALKGN